MAFGIGDTVVKPGLGICKIKSIRKMQVEGKEQSFYVLQSGDVKVMVPFAYAHAGGLRSVMTESQIDELFAFFREPILLPEHETDTPDLYAIKVDRAKDEIKQRSPLVVAAIAKTLFYKSKLCDLPKIETELLQGSLTTLAEEVAHAQHTTRQKILFKIRSILTEGRKARKDSIHHT
ncbi:MAG: CarD family transcriptional regulator [bacterium]|jgi:RNA polymerase-interacting CarD/CdnL/TRCF family regulator|nr:CarD family transcriptional regulator [bacterium]